MITDEGVIAMHPEAFYAGRQDRMAGVYQPESYDLLSFEKKAYTLGYNAQGSSPTETPESVGMES